MDTVSETVDKVDQSLQNMGIDNVKGDIKSILNLKQYLVDQVPAVTGFCIKVVLASENHEAFSGKSECRCRRGSVCRFSWKNSPLPFVDL